VRSKPILREEILAEETSIVITCNQAEGTARGNGEKISNAVPIREPVDEAGLADPVPAEAILIVTELYIDFAVYRAIYREVHISDRLLVARSQVQGRGFQSGVRSAISASVNAITYVHVAAVVGIIVPKRCVIRTQHRFAVPVSA